jgi:hypothetical protein
MRAKRLIINQSFYSTIEMHEKLRKISEEQQVSLSELIRDLLERGLADERTEEKGGEK